MVVNIDDLDAWGRALKERYRDGLERATHMLRDFTFMTLQEPYPPASKPGETAHLRTGALASSIDDVVDREAGEGVVGTEIEYGGALEHGVPANNLDPRPSLQNALTAAWPELVREILR